MSLHRNSTVVSTSSKPTSKHTTQAPLVTSVLPDEDSNDINKQYPTNLLALIVLLIVIAVIIAAVLLIRRKMRMDRLRSRLRPVYRFRASEEELLFERNDFMPKQTYYTFENNKDFYKRSYSYC